MKIMGFSACCPYEVGDTIIDEKNVRHIITEILCISFAKSKKIEFQFEIDNSGKFYNFKQIPEGEKNYGNNSGAESKN